MKVIHCYSVIRHYIKNIKVFLDKEFLKYSSSRVFKVK
jgi:hypothetical protein